MCAKSVFFVGLLTKAAYIADSEWSGQTYDERWLKV